MIRLERRLRGEPSHEDLLNGLTMSELWGTIGEDDSDRTLRTDVVRSLEPLGLIEMRVVGRPLASLTPLGLGVGMGLIMMNKPERPRELSVVYTLHDGVLPTLYLTPEAAREGDEDLAVTVVVEAPKTATAAEAAAAVAGEGEPRESRDPEDTTEESLKQGLLPCPLCTKPALPGEASQATCSDDDGCPVASCWYPVEAWQSIPRPSELDYQAQLDEAWGELEEARRTIGDLQEVVRQSALQAENLRMQFEIEDRRSVLQMDRADARLERLVVGVAREMTAGLFEGVARAIRPLAE
jgi:hypothetical protein